MLPTKSLAHKRPVLDRAVCGVAAIDIAAMLWLTPKHFAAIQLPRTKHPFPNPRAASGWLPAAAFHPANPQAEASAKFLVPFSKKGTSFRDGNTRPRTPRYNSARHSSRLFCPAPYSARCVLRPPVYMLRTMGRSLWLTPRSATGLKIAPVIQRPLRLPPPRTPRHPSPTPAHALHPRNRMRKRFETAL